MFQRSKTSRKEKIAEEIRREISQIVHFELLDPRVEGVTVTHVRVTPDLRLARIYFSIPADPKKIKEAQQGLEKASGFMKRAIADRIFLKFVPNLEFFYDESLELQKKIDLLFNEIENQKKSKDECKDKNRKAGMEENTNEEKRMERRG